MFDQTTLQSNFDTLQKKDVLSQQSLAEEYKQR